MNKVGIAGIGITKFGQRWDKSMLDLAAEANNRALTDAHIVNKDVQALFVGSMSGGQFAHQEHLGAAVADYSGLAGIPSVRLEAACASGGLALRQAYLSVALGQHDVVVACGVEKMHDLLGADATRVLAMAADAQTESLAGATFPGLYAMMARLHMHTYDTTEDHMAHVAVKNHKHAVHNDHAQFQKEISVDAVLNSQLIADPIKLLDASPLTDGAAAVVLAAEDRITQMTDTPVWIRGSGLATDSLSLHNRKDLLTLAATQKAAQQAFSQSKLTASSIKVAELHDCFTIAELLALEDIGFVDKGKSGPFTADGQSAIGGKVAVNTSGGLKAKGHPVGASGVAQAVEIALQLRGDAGKRHANADVGLTHNVGGSGGTAVVHVYSR